MRLLGGGAGLRGCHLRKCSTLWIKQHGYYVAAIRELFSPARDFKLIRFHFGWHDRLADPGNPPSGVCRSNNLDATDLIQPITIYPGSTCQRLTGGFGRHALAMTYIR